MAEHPVPAPARELTPRQAERLRAKAFKLETTIKTIWGKISSDWWKLSEALYEFHEGGYWAALGYDSLEEFLAQPELGISRRTFFKETKRWRDLVVIRGVPPAALKQLEPSKLDEVVPSVMRGEVKVEDALSDVEVLSRSDLREKYRPENRARHGQSPDGSSRLAAEDEPIRKKCPTCGTWVTEDRLEG